MPNIRTTTAVRYLIMLSVAAFLIQLVADTFFGMHLMETFGLVPSLFYGSSHYWQIVTYMFMHADMFHILFNLLILWMLGSELEAQWGTTEFVRYYFVCGLAAALFYLLVQAFFSGTPINSIPMVGSSGAVYGLLVAYGIIYSERTLLFMMVFPMKAKHFVLLLAAIEFVSTVFYSRSGVANAAHLGGMIVGFGYLVVRAYLRLKAKRGPAPTGGGGKPKKRRSVSSHLRLVVNNEVLKEFDDDDGGLNDDSQNEKPTNH